MQYLDDIYSTFFIFCTYFKPTAGRATYGSCPPSWKTIIFQLELIYIKCEKVDYDLHMYTKMAVSLLIMVRFGKLNNLAYSGEQARPARWARSHICLPRHISIRLRPDNGHYFEHWLKLFWSSPRMGMGVREMVLKNSSSLHWQSYLTIFFSKLTQKNVLQFVLKWAHHHILFLVEITLIP